MGVYHVKVSKIMLKMSKMSKKTLKCQKRRYAKMLKIINNLRLGHLLEAENSLQIQKWESTATRHIIM